MRHQKQHRRSLATVVLAILCALCPAIGAIGARLTSETAGLASPANGCEPGALIRGVDVKNAPVMAFSFDDGPSPHNTVTVMRTFEHRGLRTTFFMIGRNVARYASLAKAVVDQGFEVGNHSQTHSYRRTRIASEVNVANDVIERITGQRPQLFRSPGLREGKVIQKALAVAGMCNVFSGGDVRDWRSPRLGPSTLCRNFARTLAPGEIVLLHDGGPDRPTTRALTCMLDVAQIKRYQVVTVGQLLQMGTPRRTWPPPPVPPTTTLPPPLPHR
jgi:peptidoglycan-N-acetylglucosamine deacetylase